jgi:hypothetical protein
VSSQCPTCRATFCLNDVIPVDVLRTSKSDRVLYTVGHGSLCTTAPEDDDYDEVEYGSRGPAPEPEPEPELPEEAQAASTLVSRLMPLAIGGVLDARAERDVKLGGVGSHCAVDALREECLAKGLRYERLSGWLLPGGVVSAPALSRLMALVEEDGFRWAVLGVDRRCSGRCVLFGGRFD